MAIFLAPAGEFGSKESMSNSISPGCKKEGNFFSAFGVDTIAAGLRSIHDCRHADSLKRVVYPPVLWHLFQELRHTPQENTPEIQARHIDMFQSYAGNILSAIHMPKGNV